MLASIEIPATPGWRSTYWKLRQRGDDMREQRVTMARQTLTVTS